MPDTRMIERNHARLTRDPGDMKRFVAHPPGQQNNDTYRQFVALQDIIAQLQERVEELEAKVP